MDLFNRFKCSSPSSIEHVADKAKTLSCGHLICSKCVKYEDYKKTCVQCGIENDYYVIDAPVIILENLFKIYERDLHKIFYEKLENGIKDVKDGIHGFSQKIDNEFGLFEQKVNNKIDSLHERLEQVRGSLKLKMEEEKKQMKSLALSSIEEKLNDLQEIKNSTKEDQDKFYDLNSKCIELAVLENEMQKFDFKVNFVENENLDINENSICSLYFNNETPLTEKLSTKVEYTKINNTIDKICVLSNENIFCLSKSFIDLYDKDLQRLLERNYHICDNIEPCHVACDKDDNIFMSHFNSNSIYKLNTTLDLKETIKQSNDLSYTEFCISNDKIYTCVSNKVEIISLELKLMSIHILEFDSNHIQVLDSIACVSHQDNSNNEITRFYCLPSFQIVYEYNLSGMLLAHDKWFYIYSKNFGFHVLDKYGKYIMYKPKKCIGSWFESACELVVSNNKIHTIEICLDDETILIKIDLIDY